jgi:hypothetical protein
MGLIARIILWGILMLMLRDASSQPQNEREKALPAAASPRD